MLLHPPRRYPASLWDAFRRAKNRTANNAFSVSGAASRRIPSHRTFRFDAATKRLWNQATKSLNNESMPLGRLGAQPYTHLRSFSTTINSSPFLGATTSIASSTPSVLSVAAATQQHHRFASPFYGMVQLPGQGTGLPHSLAPHGQQQVAHFSRSRRPPPPPNRPPPRSLGGMAGMVGTGALVLFGKTKYVLAALKLTKLAPLGSMILTIGTYSMFFGLPYAAGMVGLILVHEIGHAAIMHQRGIPFSPMVFVPFMGAFIATKELPRDAWEDALIAFGGPVLGGLGAGAVCVVGHATQSQLLIALADFGFMINLFNLLPLGSMDGGRIAGALSPYMGVAGVGLGGALAYSGAIQNPVFYLLLLSGGYQSFMRFYDPHSQVPPNYYRITPAQRLGLGVGYVGLVGALALAMDLNGRFKKSPEVLQREYELEKTWDMR